MNNGRDLSDALISLGGDPQRMNPPIADFVQPVYVIDDAQFTLPNRGSARYFVNFAPSTAVAEFSAVEIVPRFGMWVRRWFNAGPGNMVWYLQPFIGSLLSTVDPLPVQTYAMPENAPLLSARTTNPLDGTVAGFPNFFSLCQKGRSLAVFVGVFAPVINVRDIATDLWVPPGVLFTMGCNVSNTAFQVVLDLDFPAVCCV